MKNISTEREFKWQRLQTIMEAIQSYRDQCKTPPYEWMKEQVKLEKELGLREERDVPVKVGEFVWDDKVALELHNFIMRNDYDMDKMVDKFKQSKIPRKVDAGKEWEIVSFICKDGDGHVIYNKCQDGKFRQDKCPDLSGYDEKDFGLTGEAIHGVKRLSDNQIFTIGDELTNLGLWSNETHKIKRIYPINGTIAFEYGANGSVVIQSAKKLPFPTTQQTQEQKPSRKYNSPYPDEVTYTCDKNFIVRLKAIVDRTMKESGYSTSHNNEKFKHIIDVLENAEDYLFASKQSLPVENKNSDYAERPPLGIMPEWRWKELRLQDVQDAIDRYVEADKSIPTDLIEEKYQLQTWLNKRKQLNALMNGNNAEKQSLPETKPMSESKETARIEMFTKEEMDKAITDAFNAARERNGQNEVALQIKPFMKYQDAADYLKSISNQK